MLTQKITKEILLKSTDGFNTKVLLDSVDEFESNLEDLKHGNSKRNLPPLKNEIIAEQQRIVNNLWNEFKKRVEIYTDDESTIAKKESALKYIKSKNIKLLDEVDKVVKLYEESSMENIVLMTLIFIFIIGTSIIIATWVIIKKIINKSQVDQLTSIYNRKKFIEELKKEINRVKRYGGKLGLIMFDIDHFKKINDKYGHDIGDEVLKEITGLVNMLVRNTDIFARWGGEEFMVIVPNS